MSNVEDELLNEDNRKQSTTTFNPNFYNPFEIKHRRRTSRGQFKILEKAFIDNPKPTGKFRMELASSLSMSPRGVQVWFQNRRAKAKQQQQQQQQDSTKEHQHQYDYSDNVVDSLKVELPSVELTSSGMTHSRSQSSLSSTTTSSTGNNDTKHVTQTNILPQVIHQSPLLLTPPQPQQLQHCHQDEWWNYNMVDNCHQTFIPEAQDIPYSFTATTTGSSNNHTSEDQLDAWAYINNLELANGQNKINVDSWISSTKEAQNNDLFAVFDNRRHSFPPTTTHVIQPQQQQHQPQNPDWETQQLMMMRRLSVPTQFNPTTEQSYYI